VEIAEEYNPAEREEVLKANLGVAVPDSQEY